MNPNPNPNSAPSLPLPAGAPAALAGAPWISSAAHQRWLAAESDRLVDGHAAAAADPRGGFSWLRTDGTPDRDRPQDLYACARLVHCFALAHLMGRPGARDLALHGLRALRAGSGAGFHDDEHGGWYAAVAPGGGPVDDTKAGYAHAFVLLAGATAAQAGLSGGRELLEEAAEVVDRYFWRPDEGAALDSWDRAWSAPEAYRGQNSNMHLTEAYLAAAEATGDASFTARALSIADLVVRQHGAAHDWRIPEHFDTAWQAVPDYNADRPGDPFRPYGSLVGHWLEWARLLLTLHAQAGEAAAWTLDAARALFARAVTEGWDAAGGLYYSVDFTGRPVLRDRLHWTIAEAIGAAVYLHRATGESAYEQWYRTFWDYAEHRLIDRAGGGWWHQLDADGRPATSIWDGKPDLYHALQATLYARAPQHLGLGEAARRGLIAC
ncbi:AGE family epimerase/isomerase [Streptomyces odontomachi]|uniref:AGE family epimerase/isomerase n=1 Tax=Streptomyces odontomachi TaxID=2944940 RepID=UPI002109CF2E|nr:AGE family epimerase/isomerase [Streptomyces sp. ODS25]